MLVDGNTEVAQVDGQFVTEEDCESSDNILRERERERLLNDHNEERKMDEPQRSNVEGVMTWK